MLNRINALRQRLVDHSLDAILVGHAPNRRYLSGFTGSAGWILLTQKHAVLAVDFRYVEQAKTESPDLDLYHIKSDFNEWMPDLIRKLGIIRLGIEADHMAVSQYQVFAQSIKGIVPSVHIVPVQDMVESLRLYKDEEEISCICKACDIADEAIDYIKSNLRAGITEKQFAWELESFLRRHESEVMPFEIIVASGANSALPHAQPGDKTIIEGEPIIVDLGARYRGYCSDMTRTFIIGKQDNMFDNIYNIVLSAQIAGLSLIKNQMDASVADGIVRSMIENAGYGDNFGHGLGHGIGIETHEAPRLGVRSKDKLCETMVFTVEPGIYIPGWGGVRIEDTVTLKDGKVACLTKSDKNALISGGK